ncbi:MAG TPA: choice-of-anchor L domain-containing protein, partial [Cytophagaceae bacterium]
MDKRRDRVSRLYNIALTPVGDLPISINYLNNGVRGYYGNDCPTGWNLNRNYYINNYNGRDLEADGLTSRLTSNLELTPNVTYRFKIGISDISDNALDSWVYIEANFTTLPVNVISFEGKSDLDGYTRLVWNVANERNFSHYMVQRSKDPVNGFEDLQSVKGTGGVLYNFLDYSGSDDYYYRLKLVDLDGSTTYSDIVFVKSVDIAEVFQIFPKEEKVYLKYDASNTQLSTVVVYNTSGQIVFSKEIVMNEGLNEFELEDLNLATGAYLATLINENTVIRTKFI